MRALALVVVALCCSPAAARTVAFVGDSLAIGAGPNLRHDLPRWHVHIDARIGRPLAEGLRHIEAMRRHPAVLAVSLFTNDDPRHVKALEVAINEAQHHADCVVWATVTRPPLGGVSYARANRLLRGHERPWFRVVRWARATRRHPGWLGPDHVHATACGYRALGRMYAAAVRACG